MKKKRSFIANEVKIAQIPENKLLDGVIRALRGREVFVDADDILDERMYYGSIFESILGENAQMEGSSIAIKNKKVLAQLEELAEEMGGHEYVQITMF